MSISINPVSNITLKRYKKASNAEISTMIDQAQVAFLSWKSVTFKERSKLMLSCARELSMNKDEYALLITQEMGKVFTEAVAEIEKCVFVCEYYAEHGESMLKDESISSDASASFVQYDPLGVVLAIMPWNFPFWQLFRFAAPSIMAGNTALLKHASNVSGCALAIQSVFERAGFPKGIFQSMIIDTAQVSGIISHPHIKAVTLTGSEKAGAEVAMQCGRQIKKTVLELGGSDPFIVLEDADIEKAVSVAVKSRMLNCGQSCIAAKRFIVHSSVYERFLHLFKSKVEALKVGDPEQLDVDMGPMAREDLAEELLAQVNQAIQDGARVVTGGKRMERAGAWFQPTILTHVTPQSTIYYEELFGPVAVVYSFEEESEAIEIANATEFGLGATIFSADIAKARSVTKYIDSGAVFINGMVKSDPRLPFGGINKSGYGRELGRHGIMEFVNAKTVWVA